MKKRGTILLLVLVVLTAVLAGCKKQTLTESSSTPGTNISPASSSSQTESSGTSSVSSVASSSAASSSLAVSSATSSKTNTAVNSSSKVSSSASSAVSSSTVKTFTLAELKQYDGKNGNPAYVAVNGKVYDVTNASKWKNGMHEGYSAGNDLTAYMSMSPHGNSVLNGLPVVGVLK